MKGLKTLSLLFLIVVLVGCAKQAQTTQQVTPAQQPEQAPAPSQSGTPVVTTTAASAPQMDTKCDVVAGIIPGSVKQEATSISVTFKNSGKKTIEGSYFEFIAGEKTSFRKNADTLEPGKTITYSVDLAQAATDLGVAVQSFVILPIQDGKACLNQRMVVIK